MFVPPEITLPSCYNYLQLDRSWPIIL